MCAPAAAIGIAGSLASGIIGAKNAQANAEDEAKALERQAQIKEINAITSRQQAAATADAESEKYEQEDGRISLGGLGGVVDTGSNLRRKQINKKYMTLALARKIYEGEVRAKDNENQAGSDRLRADNARKKGQRQAASTILGSAFSAAKGIATQIA